MRQWMVDPKYLCVKHLLGEHLEMHMFLGTIKKKISIKGYLENNLLEPMSIESRHNEIATEMTRRGMNHKTPLKVFNVDLEHLTEAELTHKINRPKAANDLITRCIECTERIYQEELNYNNRK